jgi:outer membrane protein, heavy metal efflux system
MKKLIFLILLSNCVCAESHHVQSLSIAEAAKLATQLNPALAVFPSEVKARNAAITQAWLLPNPELSIQLNEFGGSKSRSGFKSSELSFSANQLIELGYKRTKRRTIAVLEKELIDWDYKSVYLDVLNKTYKDYIQIIAAEKLLGYSTEFLELSRKTYEIAKARVMAGDVSKLLQNKAEIFLEASKNDYIQRKLDLVAFKNLLSINWGADNQPYEYTDLNLLEKVSAPPPINYFMSHIEDNPDVAGWNKKFELQKAIIKYEESKAIPDINLSAGVTRFRDTKESAFLIGATVQLPIFNRNQGRIEESRVRLQQKYKFQNSDRTNVKALIHRFYKNANISRQKAKNLKSKIIKLASRNISAMQAAFKEGKISFLNVIDSQKNYIKLKQEYIENLLQYHMASSECMRLIGKSMVNINSFNEIGS